MVVKNRDNFNIINSVTVLYLGNLSSVLFLLSLYICSTYLPISPPTKEYLILLTNSINASKLPYVDAFIKSW